MILGGISTSTLGTKLSQFRLSYLAGFSRHTSASTSARTYLIVSTVDENFVESSLLQSYRGPGVTK